MSVNGADTGPTFPDAYVLIPLGESTERDVRRALLVILPLVGHAVVGEDACRAIDRAVYDRDGHVLPGAVLR